MATVSEVGFVSPDNGPLIDFCACCGLRRLLGRVNVGLGPGQEMIRCIDCFFGPEDQPYRFSGIAIYVGQHETVNYGQTGDVLWDGHDYFFEPHGCHYDVYGPDKARIKTRLEDLHDFVQFQPKPYSRRTPDDFD